MRRHDSDSARSFWSEKSGPRIHPCRLDQVCDEGAEPLREKGEILIRQSSPRTSWTRATWFFLFVFLLVFLLVLISDFSGTEIRVSLYDLSAPCEDVGVLAGCANSSPGKRLKWPNSAISATFPNLRCGHFLIPFAYVAQVSRPVLLFLTTLESCATRTEVRG